VLISCSTALLSSVKLLPVISLSPVNRGSSNPLFSNSLWDKLLKSTDLPLSSSQYLFWNIHI
jgi:hypothetical protein